MSSFNLSFRCLECGELLGQYSNKASSAGTADEIAGLAKEIEKLELSIAAEKMKKMERAQAAGPEKGELDESI